MIFGRKPKLDDLPVYMDAGEFSQIRAIVETLAPKHCLEWGAGGSTRALLASCDFIERYVAIEHNPAWHDKVAAVVQDPRLSLHLVRPDGAPPSADAPQREREAWDMRAETDPELMRSYVAFPRSLGLAFDLVLVDGRARAFCLPEGFSLLRSGGVLVLHDAQRDETRAAVSALGRAVFLEPWQRGQVCLVRKP
jgi:predicted O-methyltransferase YrrM